MNVVAKDSGEGLEMERMRLLSFCSSGVGSSWANERSNVAYNDGAVNVLLRCRDFLVDGDRIGSGVPPMIVLSRSMRPVGSCWLWAALWKWLTAVIKVAVVSEDMIGDGSFMDK